MSSISLDHCVIHVSDWDQSNTFYRDVMGAELIKAGTLMDHCSNLLLTRTNNE